MVRRRHRRERLSDGIGARGGAADHGRHDDRERSLSRGHSPAATNASVARLAKTLVPAIAAVTVFFTLRGGATIVALLLMGYNLVTQFFPAVVFSFARRNPITSQGALSGILAGATAVTGMTLTKTSLADLLPFLPESLYDMHIGLAALILNAGVTAIVGAPPRLSRATQRA
jgi:SSS family solute:Na+ symporter